MKSEIIKKFTQNENSLIVLIIGKDSTQFEVFKSTDSSNYDTYIIAIGFENVPKKCLYEFPPTIDEIDRAIN